MSSPLYAFFLKKNICNIFITNNKYTLLKKCFIVPDRMIHVIFVQFLKYLVRFVNKKNRNHI